MARQEDITEAFDQWLDELDPEKTPAMDSSDLAAIRRALDDRERADALLHSLVRDARAHGKSWAMIGFALGVSKQAAQHKYGRAVTDMLESPAPKPKVSRGA